MWINFETRNDLNQSQLPPLLTNVMCEMGGKSNINSYVLVTNFTAD